jgi:uncharacterized membrane protein
VNRFLKKVSGDTSGVATIVRTVGCMVCVVTTMDVDVFVQTYQTIIVMMMGHYGYHWHKHADEK